MGFVRFALLSTVALAAFQASALHRSPSGARSLILPEVQHHLDDARDCSANGTPEVAAAHANLVLVGDEVKYNVQFISVPDRLHARCLKSMEGAFDVWERALDDTITFREVADPTQADVVIRFKPGVNMGKEPVAGYANWKRTLKCDGPRVQEVTFKGDLQIRTINLDGQPMPFECVRHEIAHEMGHILGLEDSTSTRDLMGPLDIDHPISGPQSYEVAAVRRIRDEAHRIRTDSLAKTQKLVGG
ncbi:matrixin family metalloprotease [Fimbriimonas ginsengisoli]|uniref:Peptidase M10 metallopeptidase domain-containing protein n=1 Tax=Fimbriimonas ginsengisoli Gsoil 348 TaxID=661478 RepID=A0A068NPP7_FIMGI|nr:matrixin family metalloprotease [Fimbriimonas ginsengisoli]AIE84730.1 hypothetical protein OP10G_1362 [Fimbriimonas ginsengisoli Gsoil 348]